MSRLSSFALLTLSILMITQSAVAETPTFFKGSYETQNRMYSVIVIEKDLEEGRAETVTLTDYDADGVKRHIIGIRYVGEEWYSVQFRGEHPQLNNRPGIFKFYLTDEGGFELEQSPMNLDGEPEYSKAVIQQTFDVLTRAASEVREQATVQDKLPTQKEKKCPRYKSKGRMIHV